jgi:NDP-sugar pyrophosphorylase family protein
MPIADKAQIEHILEICDEQKTKEVIIALWKWDIA